jgi:hypothetical protein
MLVSKTLLIFSLYLAYRFMTYFFSFVKTGFPDWDDKIIIGNATYSLFFAPYGALIGLTVVSVLAYTSGQNVLKYHLSNEEALATITKIEHATGDSSKGAPINISVNLNGVNVIYDFAPPYYQEILSVGDHVPVKYRKGHEIHSILDEKKLDLQYKNFKSKKHNRLVKPIKNDSANSGTSIAICVLPAPMVRRYGF